MGIKELTKKDTVKICIFYFSGTGNTAWSVHKLAEKLNAFNYQVKLLSCEHEMNIASEINNCDMVGLAFPIHSSFAPLLFRDFLKKLPECTNKPLIALTTAGYVAGDVLWYTLKPLENKGYIPRVFSNIIVGNNMHLPVLSPLRVTKPDRLPKKLEKAEKKIEKMASCIKEGTLHIEGIGPFGRLLGLVQRGIADNFESFAFKGFHSDEKCVQCGWCIKNCPNHSIEEDNEGVKFLDSCILCMRCYSFCPYHAIQMTDKTKNMRKYKRYTGPEGKRS